MSTVLITGAARGLGLDFVKRFAARGDRVIACARDPEAAALRAVAGDVRRHALEVTDYGAVAALARTLAGEAIERFRLREKRPTRPRARARRPDASISG